MTFLIQAVLVFVALFITDVCWAYYINQVKDESPIHAAKWAVFLYGTSLVGTVSIVGNWWMVIPALTGAFCGTYLAVWLNKRKKQIPKLEDIITEVVKSGKQDCKTNGHSFAPDVGNAGDVTVRCKNCLTFKEE